MTDQPRRCSTCGTLTTELDKVCAGCGVALHTAAGVTDSLAIQPPHAQASPAVGESPATASMHVLAPTETPQEASNITGSRPVAVPFAAAYMLNNARRRGLTGRVALAIGVGVIVAAAGTIAALAMFSGHNARPSASGNTQLTLATDTTTTSLEPTNTTTPVTEAVTTPTTAPAPTTPVPTTPVPPTSVSQDKSETPPPPQSIPEPYWSGGDNTPWFQLVSVSVDPSEVTFGQTFTVTFHAKQVETANGLPIAGGAAIAVTDTNNQRVCYQKARLVSGSAADGTYRASCTAQPAQAGSPAGTTVVDTVEVILYGLPDVIDNDAAHYSAVVSVNVQ